MQPNQQVSLNAEPRPGGRQWFFFILFWAIVTIAVFREVLLPGKILMTTDDNIGALMLLKSQLPRAFIGGWNDSVLCGMAQRVMVNWTNCLLWLLPINMVADWLHGLDLLMASVFFGCFLRMRIKNWAFCILACLVAFWVGSNFTLTYAGHIGKFGVLVFAAASLWLIEKAVHTGRSAFSILAGGAMGAMFLEQADVALFFALFLGPYAIYAFIRDRGTVSYRALARFLVPFIIVGGLVTLRPLWEGYRIGVETEDVAEQGVPKADWAFATQWSWPPEESIDFIAPGFMGWRSGEPDGPYYGRMGRSEGWEKTKQGMRNFKLENQYLGAIPVALALFSIFIAALSLASRDSRNELHAVIDRAWRADVFFWGTVFVISILLSFGKYFPLYRIFYQLPVVSAIRNPNKFLQVFQVAAAILAAYGMDAAVRLGQSGPIEGYARQKIRSYVYGVLAVGALMTIWALSSTLSWNALVLSFASDEFGRYADTIVRNRLWALLHGGLMVFAAAAGISMMTLWRGRASVIRVAPWILAALVLTDVFFLSRHYVKTMPISQIAENDVTRLLKSDMPERRVALTAQDGFYNFWLTYTFPYYGIKTINVTQMPRMPRDYQQFLGTLSGNSIRLWQLAAAGYILGPSGLWGQVSQDPGLKDFFDLVFAYNVVSSGGEVTIVKGTPSQPGQHCVLRMKSASSPFALFAGWQVIKDDEALRLLASNDFPLFESALVSEDSAEGLPEPVGEGTVGSVQLVDYRPGVIRLRASTHLPAVLRVAQKYDKGWKVSVNGRRAPLRRIDYLFLGVCVNPGVNEVVFRYAPDNRSLILQAAGVAICGAAFVWLMREKLRSRG